MSRALVYVLFAALLLAPSTGLAGDKRESEAAQGGEIVADLGFRPNPNGFKFENYGPSENDLTPATMQTLFGPPVCATGSGATCVLHPQARQWMEEQNRSMQGGHCFGFSVASLLFFDRRHAQPQQYGAASTFGVKPSSTLANFIAYGWVFQTLDRVTEATISGPPSAVAGELSKALTSRGELYTVAIFKPGFKDGHAVTPFAVERRADGKIAILVYDNNWPGETRAITIDVRSNTWKYVAATNPNEPSETYEGNAMTRTLVLYPTKPGLGTQPCAFCGLPEAQPRADADRARPRYNSFFLTGDPANHPHLLIVDNRGRRLGYVGRRFVNEIAGARVIRPLLRVPVWRRDQEPEYRVPSSLAVTVRIDGTTLRRTARANFGMILRGRNLGVQQIRLAPKQRAVIRVTARGAAFTYASPRGQSEKPIFRLGMQGVSGDREFTIAAKRLMGGSKIGFAVNSRTGKLEIDATDVEETFEYDLEMETIDEEGVEEFEVEDLELDNSSGTIDYEEWEDEGGEPEVVVEEDDDEG